MTVPELRVSGGVWDGMGWMAREISGRAHVSREFL